MLAALERPAARDAARKPPRHADAVAPALVERGGAQASSLPHPRLGALARPALRVRRRAAADRLRHLRDVPGRVGQPHDRPAVGPARRCSRSTSPGSRSPSPARSSASSRSCGGRGRRGRCRPPCATRTAVVMPVYNEQTARTFAALEAIHESVEATGLGEHFDYFILSDTTRPGRLDRRGARLPGLARSASGPDARLYYRHRPKNHHRKAGNIADFVTRWGGALRAHARARRRQPDDRRLHRAPRRRHGGRSRRRHHPVAAAHHQPQHAVRAAPAIRRAGLRPGHRDGPCRSGSGRDGNYWGHNAIIRTRAFAAHGGLPDLQGQAALRRPHPEPRLRRGGADAARRLDRLHAARPPAAPTRKARPR